MNTTGKLDSTAAASGGILSRERIIAKKGFSRWLVPPAALAIHLCIGMAYGFSVFWLPLSRAVGTATGTKVPSCAGAATTFWDKTLGTLTALTATNCEWTQFDLGWKGRGYSWEAPDALALPEPADCASSNAKSILLA
jgi:hypothetical protein